MAKANKHDSKKDWPADKVERRPIDGLIPYARNARTHSDDQVAQIAASMREWGWTNPVLVDEDGGIIAGHGRIMAARQLGLTEVPCMVANGWTEAQKRAYVIADNKLALNAEWDSELLRLEIHALDESDFDIVNLGFDGEELSALEFDSGAALDNMPELPDGDKEPFQQMTFTLHDEQAEQVRAAIDAAKGMGDFDSPNENSNGNAIARVCEAFLTDHGHS